MNSYEGMYIFPGDLGEDELEAAVKVARDEIEKLGGAVQSVTKLGKRALARKLEKHESGHFFVITFELEGDRVQDLNNRYKLTDEVFRVQIVRAPKPKSEPAAAQE